MEDIIIDKLVKKPSLWASAKHYRLEFANNTLFVLEMSKARPQTNLSRNSVNGAMANKMLDSFELKFEQQYQRSLQELTAIGLQQFSKRENCFAIEKSSTNQVNLDTQKQICVFNNNNKKLTLFYNTIDQLEQLKLIIFNIA